MEEEEESKKIRIDIHIDEKEFSVKFNRYAILLLDDFFKNEVFTNLNENGDIKFTIII